MKQNRYTMINKLKSIDLCYCIISKKTVQWYWLSKKILQEVLNQITLFIHCKAVKQGYIP